MLKSQNNFRGLSVPNACDLRLQPGSPLAPPSAPRQPRAQEAAVQTLRAGHHQAQGVAVFRDFLRRDFAPHHPQALAQLGAEQAEKQSTTTPSSGASSLST